MQLEADTTVIYAPTRSARGRWCHLCGARLATAGVPPGQALSVLRGFDPSGAGSAAVWSLCVECYHLKLHCSACGLPVRAEGVMIAGERGVYCRHCFESRPLCDTCGRPVGTHYWSRTDGRKLCDRCQSTAVSDPQYAHALYRRVRAALYNRLGMALREPCRLKLVNRSQLAELIDKSSLYSLDADSRGRCFGLFIREGRHRAIFVEYGLPQIVMMEVMAHEFAHAWQSERDILMPSAEQEGFAEWAAYKLLESWGCSRRSQRMLRRDDIYGRGLKIMLQWEREAGELGVLERAKQPWPTKSP